MSTKYPAEADRIEAWVIKNSNWLALGIIAAAFAIRVAYAGSCYLNPDEAEHFGAARPASWLGAGTAALMLAHPPLFILVLHGFLVRADRADSQVAEPRRRNCGARSRILMAAPQPR